MPKSSDNDRASPPPSEEFSTEPSAQGEHQRSQRETPMTSAELENTQRLVRGSLKMCNALLLVLGEGEDPNDITLQDAIRRYELLPRKEDGVVAILKKNPTGAEAPTTGEVLKAMRTIFKIHTQRLEKNDELRGEADRMSTVIYETYIVKNPKKKYLDE